MDCHFGILKYFTPICLESLDINGYLMHYFFSCVEISNWMNGNSVCV